MCGEHRSIVGIGVACQGSSPHVRGAPAGRVNIGIAGGIIPACAGSTSRGTIFADRRRDHPRMCGEHALFAAAVAVVMGSSPHVRGARIAVPAELRSFGIIPACAGSTSSRG